MKLFGEHAGRTCVVELVDEKVGWDGLAEMFGERQGGFFGRVVSFRKDFKVETMGWLLDRLICVVINKRKNDNILK